MAPRSDVRGDGGQQKPDRDRGNRWAASGMARRSSLARVSVRMQSSAVKSKPARAAGGAPSPEPPSVFTAVLSGDNGAKLQVGDLEVLSEKDLVTQGPQFDAQWKHCFRFPLKKIRMPSQPERSEPRGSSVTKINTETKRQTRRVRRQHWL